MEKKVPNSPTPTAMSNFVNPRIRFNKPVKVGSAALFAAVGDNDPTVTVSFDASTGAVTLAGAAADVSVNKNKVTIGFDLNATNVPPNTSVQIAGIEFPAPLKPEPSGRFDASQVFESPSTFTDGSGASHTVYGQWNNGQTELKVVDDNNVGTNDPEQDYNYKVWVSLTPRNGSPAYYASPDPAVKNEPTTGG